MKRPPALSTGATAVDGGPQATANPRRERQRRIFAAVTALERQGADVRPLVLEAVCERVIDGPAPVPFRSIRGRVRADLGRFVPDRRVDGALDRLVAAGFLTVVREADPAQQRCRVWALGPLLGGGPR